MRKRIDVLNSLLALDRPVEDITEELSHFEWDSYVIVLAEASHIIGILKRYLNGELEAKDVESWANAIEFRDDVDFGEDDGIRVKSAIYELANPLLTRELTDDGAALLIERLGP